MLQLRRSCLSILVITLTMTVLVKSDMLQDQIDEYHVEMSEELEKFHEVNYKHTQQVVDNVKRRCIGGNRIGQYLHTKGTKARDITGYLEEFNKGPCNPTIFVPGIAGSTLVASIECLKLLNGDRQLFESCGWKTCSGIGNSPKSEYKIFIPLPGSPMSILRPTEKTRTCFSKMLGFQYKFTRGQDGKLEWEDVGIPGVTVSVVGESEGTQHQEGCGFNAMSVLIADTGSRFLDKILAKVAGYFITYREVFREAGFISGLTMQAMPYDWRKSYKDNNLRVKFKSVIDQLYAITGKKVVIVAHSMGNLNTLHNLYNLDQEYKDKKIARWMSLAGPFIGTSKMNNGPLGIDSSFGKTIADINLGITADVYKKTVNLLPSTYELMLRRFFRVNAGKPFLKDIEKRITHERANASIPDDEKELLINKIFPDPTEKCNTGFKQRGEGYCHTGMSPIWDIGTLMGIPINPDTMPALMDVYSFDRKSSEFYEYIQDERFDRMDNPGVQVNVVYATHLNSISGMTYEEDPREKTLMDAFSLPKTEYEPGDGTVMITSILGPALKWAYEHKDGEANAKPVLMLEVCGNHGANPLEPFDGEDADGAKIVKETKYHGIACNCREEGETVTGIGCDHQNLVVDSKVVGFVLNAATDNAKSVGMSEPFDKMTNTELDEFLTHCRIFEMKKVLDE